MKRLFKLLLPLALSISFSVVAFATPDEDKYYIPLRDAFENNYANVSYNSVTSTIEVKLGDNKYSYSLNKNVYGLNNNTLELTHPLKTIDNKAYIYYDDVAFLYEEPNDIYKNSKKNIVTTVYNYTKTMSIPGVTYSFVDTNNNYTWIESFGYSDLEKQIPVNENTLFNVGSISKSFTALSILKLVEENKLNLDEKVVTYLPNFKLKQNPVYGGNSDDVTLRMLLAHFSGINGDVNSKFITTNGFIKDYLNNYIDILQNEYMTANPATRNSYSNSGYAVLGYLVGSLTNQNDIFTGFNKFTYDNIFAPIGMTNSAFGFTEQNKPNVAGSYINNKTPIQSLQYVNVTPAGAVFSNATDMSKFLKFMLNKGNIDDKEVFKASSIDSMITKSGYVDNLATMSTGLGTYQTNFNNRNYVGHGGDVVYFHADYQLDYENKTGVFVAGNSQTSTSFPNIITLFTLDNINNEKNNLPPTDLTKVKVDKPIINGTVKDFKEYEGYYIALGNVYFDGDNNMVIRDNNLVFTKTGDNSYYNQNVGNVSFVTIDTLDVLLIEGHITSQKVKLNKADVNFETWEGTYMPVKSLENEVPLIDSITILTDDNNNTFASFSVMGTQTMMLPISKFDDDRYIVSGIGRNLSIVITKSVKDSKTIINYSGMDFSKQ